jgi:hypothetical protein
MNPLIDPDFDPDDALPPGFTECHTCEAAVPVFEIGKSSGACHTCEEFALHFEPYPYG